MQFKSCLVKYKNGVRNERIKKITINLIPSGVPVHGRGFLDEMPWHSHTAAPAGGLGTGGGALRCSQPDRHASRAHTTTMEKHSHPAAAGYTLQGADRLTLPVIAGTTTDVVRAKPSDRSNEKVHAPGHMSSPSRAQAMGVPAPHVVLQQFGPGPAPLAASTRPISLVSGTAQLALTTPRGPVSIAPNRPIQSLGLHTIRQACVS